MDPLSDVLSLLKPRSHVSGGFKLNDDQAIRFPRYEGIKCYAILSGECWLSIEGHPDMVHLREGDCFILPRGLAFCLTSDRALEPVDFRIVLAALLSGELIPKDDGQGCFLAGGHFLFSGSQTEMLLGSLPAIVHIQKESDKQAIRWSLDRMKEQLYDPQPGGSLITQQVAYAMLVHALQLHIAEGLRGGVGWFFALADKQIKAAISCIHDNPANRWTLQELATRAGMSRSIFAQRFKEKVGSTPMEYLTRWRMMLAGDRLNNTNESVYVIALSLGYESESAFSKAFRKIMGCSPRQYGRGEHGAHYPKRNRKAPPADVLELSAAS